MHNRLTIATGGNVLPAALAALNELGYEVTLMSDGVLCKAENANNTFLAEDPLLLLGLIKLHEIRGDAWQPTGSEVDAFLKFDAPN